MMPIKITRVTESHNELVAWLCDDEWRLPEQVKAFEDWLMKEGVATEPRKLIADIGFSPRPGAAGGGACFTLQAMKVMVTLGLEFCLSEYPPFIDENDSPPPRKTQ